MMHRFPGIALIPLLAARFSISVFWIGLGWIGLGAPGVQEFAARAATTERVVVNRFSGLAIEGYDPVAYFTDGKAVRGSEEHSYKWLNTTWYFSNDEHRRAFVASPISYAPQYGGLCAEGVAAHGEATVNIEPVGTVRPL